MAFCTNCGFPINGNESRCPNCGANQIPQNGYVRYVDPKDHTAEFSAEDISQNKVIAMAAYIMGIVGIIIAFLAAPNSGYVSFHARQSLKLSIVQILLGILAGVLCWTLIVPLACGVCMVILLVIRIISFFQVCSGKAKEVAIVSSLGFLK